MEALQSLSEVRASAQCRVVRVFRLRQFLCRNLLALGDTKLAMQCTGMFDCPRNPVTGLTAGGQLYPR
jgi:hypothetical protein